MPLNTQAIQDARSHFNDDAVLQHLYDQSKQTTPDLASKIDQARKIQGVKSSQILDKILTDNQKQTPVPGPVPVDANAESAAQYHPTFPANAGPGGDSTPKAAAKVVGNIPSSTANFAKGVVSFLNPVNTVKTIAEDFKSAAAAGREGVKAFAVIKELPAAAYHTLVPQFFQKLFSGDTEGAQRVIENDPVGQLAPVLLAARGMAEKAGYGAQFDQATSKATSVVAKPAAAVAGEVGKFAGNVATNTLGVTTGAGGEAVRQGFEAGKAGGTADQAFTSAMRGKTTETQIAQNADNALSNIVNSRRTQYVSDLEKVSANKKSLDVSPIKTELATQLKTFGVTVGKDGQLDFSRSSIGNKAEAINDIKGVYDDINNWGKKTGDRTPVGLDTLKKRLGDLYSESGQARALVQAVKSKVSEVLKQNVPEYDKMTSSYAKASALLDDIRKTTRAGTTSGPETVMKKLTGALKDDKGLRLELLKQLDEASGGGELVKQAAGAAMKPAVPEGLIGKGIDVYTVFGLLRGLVNPAELAALASTSPRLVGEFVRALGVGSTKAKSILFELNHMPQRILPSSQSQKPTASSQAAITSEAIK